MKEHCDAIGTFYRDKRKGVREDILSLYVFYILHEWRKYIFGIGVESKISEGNSKKTRMTAQDWNDWQEWNKTK